MSRRIIPMLADLGGLAALAYGLLALISAGWSS